MAFDLSTAKPVSSGFDISSAKPFEEEKPTPEKLPGSKRRSRREEKRPESDGVSLYENLPQETIDQIKQDVPMVQGAAPRTGRGYGAVEATRRRLANLERLRQVNPVLAEVIENTSEGQAALIGAGKFASDIQQGVGRLLGFLDQEQAAGDEEAYEALRGIKSATDAGNFLAQGAALAAPTAKAAQISKFWPRAGVQAGIGATEGGLQEAGQGGSAQDIALAAGTTAASNVFLGELFSPTAIGKLKGFANSNKTFISPYKKKIVDAIGSENPTDDIAAKYVLDGMGSAKTNPAFRAAKHQGFDDGSIAIVMGAKEGDRNAIREMVKIAKRGFDDKIFKIDNRPGSAVGKTLKSRYDSVAKIKSQAGKEVKTAAQALKGSKVDLSDVKTQMLDGFDELRVTLDPESRMPIFKGSQLAGSAGSGSRPILREVYQRISNIDSMDAFDAHDLKRFIQSQVHYGTRATNQKPLSAEAENLLKGVAKQLNQKLRTMSDDYARANDKFSQSADALEKFSKAAGRKFDPFSDRAEEMLGQESRKLTSNYNSRIPLADSIDSLESVAKTYGINFNDSVKAQFAVLEDIERLAKTHGQNTLRGQTGLAVSDAIPTAENAALQIGKAAYNKATQVNPRKAMKALEKLLEVSETVSRQ